MLSYRHAFHAGNHADVFKHLILIQIIQYMVQKSVPFWVVDTHAGAGHYNLESPQAEKLGEYKDGIERIWHAAGRPKAVAEYLDRIQEANPEGKLRFYPGSPQLVHQDLRPDDKLRLFELHSNEVKLLAKNFNGTGRQVHITEGDGLAALKALLPPPPRRGVVFIDPSYETRNDYTAVLHALKDAMKRFPTGTYVVWYPLLAKIESRQFADRCKHLDAPNWLHATLQVQGPPQDGIGMYGSGMFIINPPWTLADTLKQTLPWLTQTLSLGEGAGWKLETQGK